MCPAAHSAPCGPGNGPRPAPPRAASCRIPGCRAVVGRRRLMCRPHWYQVPKPLRDLIWATWRSGAGAFTPGYLQAVRQAVAAVQAATAARKDPP